MLTYFILFLFLCAGNKAAQYVEETLQLTPAYPEIPCDLLPLSSWRGDDGDLWAVSASDIWWYNSANQTWQSEPLPNVTSLPWKVACVIHGCHVILHTDLHFLIYHTNHRKWQEIDSDPFSTHSAVICQKDVVLILDFHSGSVCRLNPSDGATEKVSDIDEVSNFPNETEGKMVVWQSQDECTYVLCHSRIFKINGTHWVVLSERTTDQWPKKLSQPVSWIEENVLWVWNQINAWAFDTNSQSWNQVHIRNGDNLASAVIMWAENGQLCAVKSRNNCTSSYVTTVSWCLHSVQETNSYLSYNSSNSKNTLSAVTQSDVEDSHHTVQTYWHPIISPSFHGSSQSSINGSSVTWQQDHSSGFGPVIFFGTSLSIFGVVAIVWCVKRCVHFPKEALLLRDPPSVRYTAIPEAVA